MDLPDPGMIDWDDWGSVNTNAPPVPVYRPSNSPVYLPPSVGGGSAGGSSAGAENSKLQLILNTVSSVTNSISRAIAPGSFQSPGSYNYGVGAPQGSVYDPYSQTVNPNASKIGSDAGGAVGSLFDSVARIVQEHPLAIGGAVAALLLFRSGRKR